MTSLVSVSSVSSVLSVVQEHNFVFVPALSLSKGDSFV
jgi:hypothetical protein